ncbi:MAG: hypothetical protein ACSLFQ_11600 [Thermoanaerobaculia bacterium]
MAEGAQYNLLLWYRWSGPDGAYSPFTFRLYLNDLLLVEKSGQMDSSDELSVYLCNGKENCTDRATFIRRDGCFQESGQNWFCPNRIFEELPFGDLDGGLPRPIFELTDSALETERRVLIGAYRPASVPVSDPVYAYLSTKQTEDGKFRVTVTGIDAQGAPVNGQTVHFRIVDPPEQAPPLISPPHGTATDYYVKDAHENDNRGIAGAASLSATAAAMVNGQASVDLIVASGVAAGDNYRIEASYNSAFFCRSGCARSGVITAWKRVYIEQKKMFRRGAYVAATVEPAKRDVRVADVSKLMELKGKNNLAVMIHGPAIIANRTQDQTFYQSAPIKIVSVEADIPRATSGPGTVTLESAVGARFYGPEVSNTEYTADAIGIVSDDSALFVPNAGYVADFYQSAFLDVRTLTDTHTRVSYFPYVEKLDEGDNRNLPFLAGKWIEKRVSVGSAPQYLAVTEPNHRFLVGGALSATSPGTAGLGNPVSGWGLVFVKWIDGRTSITVANRKKLNGEITVHELGHVLGNRHDYDVKWYSRFDQYCIMQDAGAHWFDGTKPLPSSYDELMEFHLQSEEDSEYFKIRKRVEPIPQSW